MPTVDYRCQNTDCKDETTEFYSINEAMPESLKCGNCGEQRTRIWGGRAPSIGPVMGAGGSPRRGSL